MGNGCMADYKFKSIVHQEDLDGLAGSGIVGLSPSAAGMGAQLFVPSLYEQGAIKRNMFSMYIDHLGKSSKILIGGYDLKKYASSDLKWYNIASPLFWEFTFNSPRMGDFELKTETTQMMADTGTSLNMLPEDDFQQIYDHFFKDKFKCHVLPNTLVSCDCTEEEHQSIPDLTFKIEGDEYVIPRDQWFERSGQTCIIKFMHGPAKQYWILGLNFFNNYYSVFDYEGMKIGFAKSKNFGEETSSSFISWATGMLNLQSETMPQKNDQTSLMWFGLAIVVGIAMYLVCTNSKKKVRASVVSDADFGD